MRSLPGSTRPLSDKPRLYYSPGDQNLGFFMRLILPSSILLLLLLTVGCSDSATQNSEELGSTTPIPSPFASDIVAIGVDSTAVGGSKDTQSAETDVQGDGETSPKDVAQAEDPYGLPDDPEEGEFGWPCDENSECNSGYCIESAVGKVCTETCLENCPDSWVCSEVTVTGTDTTYICKPKYLHLCDPCLTHEDCADNAAQDAKCLPYESAGQFCGVDCSQGQICPIGYTCQDFAGPADLNYQQCAPESGVCSCSPLAEGLGLSTTCSSVNEAGSCEGTRTCIEGQGLSDCDALAPSLETCDGLDNDCNDFIDDLGEPEACEITNDFGTCPGLVSCSNGLSSCAGEEPVPELCDGLDNDCDGLTDEDLCDDGDPCTKDTCTQLEEVLECNHAIDDTLLCDDGDICTQTDKCEAGICVGFNPEVCDDGNPCTDDTCDPTVGCLTSFNTIACEDGNACTEGDVCESGVCQSGGIKSCDDDNPCTADSCDPAVEGGCLSGIANEGFTCDYPGLDPCQQAKCSLGACVPFNANGGGCNTGDSNCSAGVCSGGLCMVIPGQTCEVDGGICTSDVPGTCTSSGSCVPQQDGGCVCDTPCNGICLCCKLAGIIPVSVCIPF